MKRAFSILLIIFTLTFIAGGQNPKSDSDGGKYKLLATIKTSTMQKELSEAASQGYRILVGSPTSGTEMALFLERVATPPNTYQYKLLATTRTSTMERELNEAAEGGFRLLPKTMIAKPQTFGGTEIVMILERSPSSTKKYSYKLLATSRTSTLQKEVTDAMSAGYVLVGMVSRGEHMVIMEREDG